MIGTDFEIARRDALMMREGFKAFRYRESDLLTKPV
jgi:hypothetical protein